MIKKKYKGIAFFDIDGTLVDERAGIYMPTPATRTSLAKLRKNGYLTGIATGRAKCYMPEFGVDFDCYVTSNGAAAEVFGRVIHSNCIPQDKLRRFTQYCDDKNIAFNLESGNVCYYGTKRYALLESMFKVFNINFEEFQPYIGGDVSANKAVIVFDSTEDLKRIKEDLGSDFIITQHHKNNSADVDMKGMSKAVGISAAAKYLNIGVSDIYAFGDDKNDIDMLTYAGCGIAMTPHAAELDSAADMFCGSVEEEGITSALTKLGLI